MSTTRPSGVCRRREYNAKEREFLPATKARTLDSYTWITTETGSQTSISRSDAAWTRLTIFRLMNC